MTLKKNNNSKIKGSTLSKVEFNKLDFDKLTPEQIQELMENATKELTAAAHLEDDFSATSEGATRPPWIHFT